MNKLGLSDLKYQDVQVKVNDTKDGIALQFIGLFDYENPDKFLDPFLEDMHEKALEKKIDRIVLDCKDMEYINSITYRSFIKWVIKANKLPEDKRYKIKIIYNVKTSWSASTLRTIYHLAPEIVTLEEH